MSKLALNEALDRRKANIFINENKLNGLIDMTLEQFDLIDPLFSNIYYYFNLSAISIH
jgi:hypothetical protein